MNIDSKYLEMIADKIAEEIAEESRHMSDQLGHTVSVYAWIGTEHIKKIVIKHFSM